MKHERPPRSSKTARWTIIVLTVLALGLMAVIIRPFASALFVAAVLAGALHPWYQRFALRLRGRRQLAAGLVTLAVMLVVVIPVASLTVVLAREAEQRAHAQGADDQDPDRTGPGPVDSAPAGENADVTLKIDAMIIGRAVGAAQSAAGRF